MENLCEAVAVGGWFGVSFPRGIVNRLYTSHQFFNAFTNECFCSFAKSFLCVFVADVLCIRRHRRRELRAPRARPTAIAIDESPISHYPQQAKTYADLNSFLHFVLGYTCSEQVCSRSMSLEVVMLIGDFGLAELLDSMSAYTLFSTCPAPAGASPTNKQEAARETLADRVVATLRCAVQAGYGDWSVNPCGHRL
jgi:hypothetical protein